MRTSKALGKSLRQPAYARWETLFAFPERTVHVHCRHIYGGVAATGKCSLFLAQITTTVLSQIIYAQCMSDGAVHPRDHIIVSSARQQQHTAMKLHRMARNGVAIRTKIICHILHPSAAGKLTNNSRRQLRFVCGLQSDDEALPRRRRVRGLAHRRHRRRRHRPRRP